MVPGSPAVLPSPFLWTRSRNRVDVTWSPRPHVALGHVEPGGVALGHVELGCVALGHVEPAAPVLLSRFMAATRRRPAE